MSMDEVREKCIVGSFSRAWKLGNAILQAQVNKVEIAEAITSLETDSEVLIKGKVRIFEFCAETYFLKNFKNSVRFTEDF